MILITICIIVLSIVILIMTTLLERVNKRLMDRIDRMKNINDEFMDKYNNLLEENFHLCTQLKDYQDRVMILEEEANELQLLEEE